MHPSPPVLLLLFNRIGATRQLMQALAQRRPNRLFVSADGPRLGRPDDLAKCDEVHRLATKVDWPCEIHTLFRPINIGLAAAVITAITWFFDQVDHGVILEDDCIPSSDFLPFADEMLRRYADQSEIMHVSGVNMCPGGSRTGSSYHYATLGHIWGWATWRRAWNLFDPHLSN